MRHSAKKLNKGDYQYRGWIISKKQYGWVTYESASNATDVTETLKEAKLLIDYYLNEMV